MTDVYLSFVTRSDPLLLDKVLQQSNKMNCFAVDTRKYGISEIGEIQT